jgi:hypothetical protein
MSFFHREPDPAAEAVRVERQRQAEEFERRRLAQEQQAQAAAERNRRPSAEEQERDAKAAILARQAARLARESELAPFRELRTRITTTAAQAGADRDQALQALDLEAAIAAQTRATAASALLPPLEAAVCRRFSVGSF